MGGGLAVGCSGQDGRWQKPPVGAAMIPIGTHTMAQATLVGYRDIQSAVGATLSPHHLISAVHWYHSSSHVFAELANALQKSRPRNINI